MRKNRIARYCAALCGAMIALVAFLGAFGPTSARYYSKAAMSGDFDYVKILGTISLYHPDWVGGYNQQNNGVFEVLYQSADYTNIHYAVNSAVDGETNEEDVAYYVRIVAEDGGDALPIKYDVHEFNKPSAVYPLVQGKGYGPFPLKAGSAEEFQFSVKAYDYSAQFVNEHQLQQLRVQMVTGKKNGGLRVIAEAPLQMQFVGCEVNLNFIDSASGQPLGTGKLPLRVGSTLTFAEGKVSFSDPKSVLYPDGISWPQGYEFSGVTCSEINASETGSITIPNSDDSIGKTYDIDVRLTKTNIPVPPPVVPVKFYININGSETEVSSTTVTMNSDSEGNCTYTFTSKECRELCPELAGMTSFAVYIANKWGSTYEVGNTHEMPPVVVDYNKTYTTSWADFNLTDEGSYIKIIAWW